MENIFKTSKRGVIAIVILCILLGIAGTCVNVTATAEENTATVEKMPEETTTVNEETPQELVPVMAQRCGNACTHEDMVFDHSEKNGTILVFVCDRCGAIIRRKAG